MTLGVFKNLQMLLYNDKVFIRKSKHFSYIDNLMCISHCLAKCPSNSYQDSPGEMNLLNVCTNLNFIKSISFVTN